MKSLGRKALYSLFECVRERDASPDRRIHWVSKICSLLVILQHGGCSHQGSFPVRGADQANSALVGDELLVGRPLALEDKHLIVAVVTRACSARIEQAFFLALLKSDGMAATGARSKFELTQMMPSINKGVSQILADQRQVSAGCACHRRSFEAIARLQFWSASHATRRTRTRGGGKNHKSSCVHRRLTFANAFVESVLSFRSLEGH